MRHFFLLFLCLALFSCEAAEERARNSYILTTASTGGTYYPVGVAISTLVTLELQEPMGISLSAINSAGSGENVKLMRSGEVQFALVQGLFGYWARTGKGAYGRAGPLTNMRSITMLWQNVEHFVVRTDYAETGTLEDLKGLGGGKFGVGNRNSGAMESTRMILDSIGVARGKDLEFAYLSYNASAEALQNRNIAGFNAPAGVPVSAISQALAAIGDEMTILTVTDEELAEIDEGVGLWQRFVIPAGTYPDQESEICTASQPNFLAVNADVDEEVVYQITKVIYENLPFLYSVHRATRAMTLDNAVTGLPVPLHPGALRYFREQGIEVPEDLIPPEAVL